MNEPKIRPEIEALAKREEPITLAEYEPLYLNSWERELLVPNLDHEAFAWCVENCMKNLTTVDRRRPASTYEDSLALVWLPEAMRRLAAANEALKDLETVNRPRYPALPSEE